MEPVFTIKEVAKHLQVSERTISRLLLQHAIPVLKPGRRIRIPEASVKRLLDAIKHVPKDGNDLLIKIMEG